MSWLVDMRSEACRDAFAVGGKASGCARLARRRLRVPRGFAIHVDAQREVFASAGLDAERERLIQLFSAGGPDEELRRACEALEKAAAELQLPEELATELAERAAGLGRPLAVRSSAIVEDSAETAFAGLFHSELNVEPEGIGAAVARCWAASFSFPTLCHALAEGIDPRQLRVGILVQEMVAATRSGALFTRDPSGRRSGMLLVWTEGCGDRLMDGAVGGSEHWIEDGHRGAPDASTARLLRAARKLERRERRPLDIEWAEDSRGICFLQARPITTLALRAPAIEWTRDLSEERYPEPISPLGWSALQGVLEVNLETLARRFGLVARDRTHVATVIDNYVYTNAQFFRVPGSLRPNPLAHVRLFPGYLRHLGGLLVDLPRTVRGPVSAGLAVKARVVRAAILPHAAEISKSWRADLSEILQRCDDTYELDFGSMADDQLFAAHQEIEEIAKRYMEPDLAVYVVKTACQWLLESIAREVRPADPASFLADITAGLADNRTLAMNAQMDDIVLQLEREPEAIDALSRGDVALFDQASADLRAALTSFWRDNGHLTSNWDLMQPTWGEDGQGLCHMLQARRSTGGSRSSLVEKRLRGVATCERAREEARGHFAQAPWFAGFLGELVATTHEFMAIDEEHRFYASRLFPPLRALFAECGARLAARKIIARAEDVYFLDLREVREAMSEAQPFSRRLLVARRRTSFERSRQARPPQRYLGGVADQPAALLPFGGEELRGHAASPGVARGRVRVVLSAADASQFLPGEILVTATPNPVFTPIYSAAAGLISATGSVLSHGLVSAREYSLPAVIGIEDVTRRLRTGQKVSVNGDLGVVSIETE